MICTVTPTIMDGLVVKWWRSVEHAEYGSPPLVSASRNGVMVDGYLHEVPDPVMHKAISAYMMLKRDEVAAVKAMATHRFSGPFKTGAVMPIEPEAPDA